MNVSLAAYGVGLNRRTVYRHMKEFPDFAKGVADAEGYAVDKLEAAAFARAEKKSDKLLIFLLKAHRPEKYADKLTIILGKGDLSKMDDNELAEYETLLSTRTATGARS